VHQQDNSRFQVSPHVYFCSIDTRIVFLDLRNDKYLCLSKDDSKAINGLLNCCRTLARAPAIDPAHSIHENSAIIDALIKSGLIDQMTPRVARRRTQIPLPSVGMMDDCDPSACRPHLMHVSSFFAAAVIASASLKHRSIESIVHGIRKRRLERAGPDNKVDLRTVSRLFAMFKGLRPYYPRPYLCLFDSLALLHFLARYDQFPSWVFGVKLQPFAAHCWVQADSMAINDLTDYVRRYTPIMCV
jgi:hypothetical protein